MATTDDISLLRHDLERLRDDVGQDLAVVSEAVAQLAAGLERVRAGVEQVGVLLHGAVPAHPAPTPTAPAVAVDRVPQLVDALGRAFTALERRLDAAATTNGGQAGRTAAGHPPPAADPFYPSAQQWVERWFLPNVERRLTNSRRWCNRWDEHPEVRQRIWMLWLSWEQADRARDPLLMSSWFTDHLDKHLPVIFSADGPFAGCAPDRHSPRPRFDGIRRGAGSDEDGPGGGNGHHGATAVADRPDPDRTQEVRTP